MTRIRYTKMGRNYRTEWLPVGLNLVLMGFVQSDSSYGILDLEGDIVTSGKARNIRCAKEKLRKLLVSSGLILEDEIRRRS